MKNLCRVGIEIANEFGYSEEEVREMIKRERTDEVSGTDFVSLFDDPEFMLAERRTDEIYKILNGPRIVETMLENSFNDHDVTTIVTSTQLLYILIEIYDKEADIRHSEISNGFEKLIFRVLRECARQKLLYEVARLTRITVRISNECGSESRGNAVSLGLTYISRNFDMLNEIERRNLVDCVDEMIHISHSIKQPGLGDHESSFLNRWKSIIHEVRFLT